MILRNFAIILIQYSVFLPQLYTYVLRYVIMCYIFVEMISHRIFKHKSVCVCARVCMCMYVLVYACVYVCMCMCVCVCVCDVER